MIRIRLALVVAGIALGVARLAWSAFTPGSVFVFQAFAGAAAQQQSAPVIEPWIVGGTVTAYEDHMVHSIDIAQGNNALGFTQDGLYLYSTFSNIAVGGAYAEIADELVELLPSGQYSRYMRVQGWGAPYDGTWFSTASFTSLATNTLLVVGRQYTFKRFSPGTVSLQIIQNLDE